MHKKLAKTAQRKELKLAHQARLHEIMLHYAKQIRAQLQVTTSAVPDNALYRNLHACQRLNYLVILLILIFSSRACYLIVAGREIVGQRLIMRQRPIILMIIMTHPNHDAVVSLIDLYIDHIHII